MNSLLKELLEYRGPVGIDTETIGWNPKMGSPVGLARIFCVTLAWYTGEKWRTVFLKDEWRTIQPWLESPLHFKVGANLMGFDRHVFSNEDVEFQGIRGDIVRMSRLLNNSWKTHGLKDWCGRLEIAQSVYKDVATRYKPAFKEGPKKEQTRKAPGGGYKIHYCPCPTVGVLKSREIMGLEVLWTDYPQRRELLKEYALVDAVAPVKIYSHLVQRLENQR